MQISDWRLSDNGADPALIGTRARFPIALARGGPQGQMTTRGMAAHDDATQVEINAVGSKAREPVDSGKHIAKGARPSAVGHTGTPVLQIPAAEPPPGTC